MSAATKTGTSGDTTAPLSYNKNEYALTQLLKGEEDGSEADEGSPSKEEQGTTTALESSASDEAKKWPGWPGESVFRLIVPVQKVGSIIGRKGELIKKLCEETRARVRILEGAIGTNERIVLISAKEDQEAEISPAMDAVLRVFKRVNDVSESTGDGAEQASSASIRLLVASSQAINLIGKHGAIIKSFQESSSATIRVLSGDELPYYATADERVVDVNGEYQKVLKALEAVVGHLRKFLVDHSVLPLFEKISKMPAAAQDREPEPWGEKTLALAHSSHSGLGNDYGLPAKRESLYSDHDSQLDSQFQRSSLSLYGHDPALSGGLRSSGLGLGRSASAIVTQVTQTMQIPLSYAEDIIGIGGANIAYIRRTSGAILTVQETRGVPEEITVEIKGNASEVHKAQQIIQDLLAGHKDPPAPSSYGSFDTGLRSAYSHHLGSSGYSSSLSASSLGGYGASGLGGYGSYRF